MTQVVTNENMLEFIQNRTVPEFKAPDAKAEAPKTEGAQVADTAKGVVVKDVTIADSPRDLTTGKFVKADGEKPAKVEGEKEAAHAAVNDDEDDGASLSEAVKRKIDRIVAKKHRAMKEAEEFGADAYRQRLAAERRAEELQREIEALRKSGTGPRTATDVDPDEPKQDDFKTVGEYTRALTKYEVAKAAKNAGEATKKQSEQEKQQSQAAERAETFVKRQSEFMKTTPDFEEVVGDADFDFPNVGMQYMVESEYGPQLAYHFAKNPKDADRLRTLSPGRVLAELGKLEAKFEKQPEPAKPAVAATPSVSRAPAPITPIEGKSTVVETDPAKMSFRELREYERQREATRRAGR